MKNNAIKFLTLTLLATTFNYTLSGNNFTPAVLIGALTCCLPHSNTNENTTVSRTKIQHPDTNKSKKLKPYSTKHTTTYIHYSRPRSNFKQTRHSKK